MHLHQPVLYIDLCTFVSVLSGHRKEEYGSTSSLLSLFPQIFYYGWIGKLSMEGRKDNKILSLSLAMKLCGRGKGRREFLEEGE